MRVRKIDIRKLRRLCADLELSDIQIAKRFGVTREGIRFARNQLGIKGRGRERITLLKQRRAQSKEKLRLKRVYAGFPALRRIKAHAAKLNIDFELLQHPTNRRVRIENAECYLVKGRFFKKSREGKSRTFMPGFQHLRHNILSTC
jgi:hypothetical protein